MLRCLLVVICSLCLAACTLSAPSTSVTTVPQQVQPLIDSLTLESVERAFAALSAYQFEREVQTEVFDAEATLAGSDLRLLRYTGPSGNRTIETLDRQVTGQLKLDTSPPELDDPAELGEDLVSERPAYLVPRTTERYTYQLLPDTAWTGGQTVRTLAVTVRPDATDEETVHAARLHLEEDTLRPVGIVHREEVEGLLFSETRTVSIQLQRHVSGDWLPERLVVESIIRLPLQEPRHVRTQNHFRAIERIRPTMQAADARGSW